MEGRLTSDCRRTHCQDCGVCPKLGVRVIDRLVESDLSTVEGEMRSKVASSDERFTYRAKIKKGDEISILSHLDYVDVYRRALIRSKLPVAYSQGFNPHMKMSFASALAVGTTSDAEYFDFELTARLDAREVMSRLNAQLPRGAELLRLKMLEGKAPALMALADASSYEIEVGFDGDESGLRNAIERFNVAKSIPFTRVTPKKTRELDLKRYVLRPIEYAIEGSRLRLTVEIKISTAGSVKPIEILKALNTDQTDVRIHRLSLTSNGRDLFFC